MKLTKISAAVTTGALALLAFAGNASATTLEIGGVAQGGAVTIHASTESLTSSALTDTSGSPANTCAASSLEASTSVFTGSTVSGPVSSLAFSKCTEESVVVDTPGSLTIEHIAGTTHGTVRSIGAKFTTPSAFGSLTCTTAAAPGTDIGTLTGRNATTAHATLDIKAVLNCGFFLPSAKWEAAYWVTTPTGLGVSS
jgi:hypothetical protein